MTCDVEIGACGTCGKDSVVVSRTYFNTNIKCDCCVGKHSFFLYTCANCEPIIPEKFTVKVDKSNWIKTNNGYILKE